MTDQSHLGVALQGYPPPPATPCDPPFHTYISPPPSEVDNWPPALKGNPIHAQEAGRSAFLKRDFLILTS